MKTLFTAAAFTLVAATQSFASTEAGIFDLDAAAVAAPKAEETARAADSFETAVYCEWITVYDYWGNWVTLYECY